MKLSRSEITNSIGFEEIEDNEEVRGFFEALGNISKRSPNISAESNIDPEGSFKSIFVVISKKCREEGREMIIIGGLKILRNVRDTCSNSETALNGIHETGQYPRPSLSTLL